MKGNMRRVLQIVLAVVFLVSAVLVVRQLIHYRRADQAYEQAQQAVQTAAPEPTSASTPAPTTAPTPTPEITPALTPAPTPEPTPEPLAAEVQYLLNTDLNALRTTNERVLGWILIPDTPVDYPLIAVNDNNEYLRRAWDGSKNSAGCIFLECKNQRDFSDFNTLIYGHYMRNGTMFGSLKYYGEADYLAEHPFIYIVTDENVRRYQVFSTYEADITSDTYRLYFEDDARRQSVLDYYVSSTEVETGITPTVEEHILTLSTCTGTGTYDTRWVVQAVLDAEFVRESE